MTLAAGMMIWHSASYISRTLCMDQMECLTLIAQIKRVTATKWVFISHATPRFTSSQRTTPSEMHAQFHAASAQKSANLMSVNRVTIELTRTFMINVELMVHVQEKPVVIRAQMVVVIKKTAKPFVAKEEIVIKTTPTFVFAMAEIAPKSTVAHAIAQAAGATKRVAKTQRASLGTALEIASSWTAVATRAS